VLKRYEDDGKPQGDREIVAYCAQNHLYRCQQALKGTIENFPVAWARPMMRFVVFPLGARFKPAPDALGSRIVAVAMEPGEVRDRLTRHMYLSNDVNDATGLLEVTLKKVIQAEEIEKKVDRAVRQGAIRRFHGIDWIGDAVTKSVISAEDGRLLREVEALTQRVIAVDHFDPAEVRPNYMTPGHNARAVQQAAE
jgi:acyl-CoA dehydrogenase